MLTTEALNAAMPLATVVDGRSLLILPKAGTVLDQLVRATRSAPDLMALTTPGNYEPRIEDIVYLANETVGEEDSPHDKAMDEVVETVAGFVQQHLAYAKNVVRPAVMEIGEKVTEILRTSKPAGLRDFEVRIHNPAGPLMLDAFASKLKGYDEVTFATPKMKLNLPNKSYSELLEMVKTGSGSIDDAVGAWLAGKGESWLPGIWSLVFQLDPNRNNVELSFSDICESKETGLESALAIFLLATNLFDNPPENMAEGISLGDYNRTMSEFRDQAGFRVARGVGEVQSEITNQRLVRSVVGGVTEVNAVVYSKWIADGGNNDILLGNALSATPLTTVAMINERAADLASAWRQHVGTQTRLEASNEFVRMKEAFTDVFARWLENEPIDENNSAQDKQNYFTLFTAELNRVAPLEAKNVYHVALRLVCRSRYFRTEAEFILSTIEEAMQENPALDVREAAAIAAVQYVARWFASQLTVTAGS